MKKRGASDEKEIGSMDRGRKYDEVRTGPTNGEIIEKGVGV